MGNEIILYGTVGMSFWDEGYFTAAQVREQLAGMSGPITVRINSGGGIASEGQAIYTMLRDYPDKVSVVVDAVAASAASLIAMAGDTITMRDGAWMLVHDPAQPWLEERGTEADHLRAARQLGVMANAYASVYAKRAGISAEEARQIMRDETVMDGPMAMALGFADATEDTPAEPVARFDYRIYAHAPEAAREASQSLGEGQGRVAVLASIAGVPRITLKQEPVMADENKAVEATSADDKAKPEAAEADTANAVTTAAIKAERERARRITEITAAAGLPVTMASEMIEKGLTLEAASDLIVAKAAETGDMNRVSMGPARSHIVRDERETKRAGAEAALLAKMSGKAPTNAAATPFISMSIAEMAADLSGQRLGFLSDRKKVIEMAMHSTSDFSAVFESVLNKRLQDAYATATPTYMAIARRYDFNDMRPHPISGIGSWPVPQVIAEGGEIPFGTTSDKKETLTPLTYGSAMAITEDALINDDLNSIQTVINDNAGAVARRQDQVFWTMFLSGANADGPTLTETGRQVFNTNAADNTKAGTPTAITVAALGAARASMRTKRGLPSAPGAGDGPLLNFDGTILLVGPDKETEAQQIVAPIQALQSSNVNPFANLMTVVVSPYITGNAWYLLTDPARFPTNFAYGNLRDMPGPRLRMAEPFGRLGVQYSVDFRFGCGAIDFRFGWKNAGA